MLNDDGIMLPNISLYKHHNMMFIIVSISFSKVIYLYTQNTNIIHTYYIMLYLFSLGNFYIDYRYLVGICLSLSRTYCQWLIL